jgi:iron complex transport system substrate-binding protein
MFSKQNKISLLMYALMLCMITGNLYGISVTDALGRSVQFDKAPVRIVVAGRGLLMVADAMYLFPGASSRIVALEKITQGKDNFLSVVDPQFHKKVVLPIEVGPEQIAAAKPDAVILKSYMYQKLGRPLESLGIKVVCLDFETPQQYERDILTLGRIFQNDARGRQIISFYNTRLERIKGALDKLHEDKKPSVLLMYYSERDGKVAFNVPPPSWMQTILVESAGGRPIWKGAAAGKGWKKVGFEQIAVWDPDLIFITAYFNDVDEVVQKLYDDSTWCALQAVRENRLYAFPADYYSWDQPDPRWILGLLWLATKIHPDAFSDIDIMEEIKVFYKELYGQDESAYYRYIHPLLNGDLP